MLPICLVALAVAPLPRVTAVLDSTALVTDSLFLGKGQSRWPVEFVTVAPSDETWMRLSDPYGGVYTAPLTHIAKIGEEAVAFSEARTGRSVLFLPPAVTLTLLGLSLVGIAAGVSVPVALSRRRYVRERARRTQADVARHHLAEGREAERLSLARDLHDGPLQDLQSLQMRLTLLARADAAPADLTDAAADVQRVAGELRRTSEALRPPALGPFGLAAALRTAAARLADAAPGVDIDADLDDDGQMLPEAVRLALFRVAQEAMTNAVRHGRPRRVAVTLRVHPGSVVLTVEDDGAGFEAPADPQTPVRPGHYGLVGMAERAEAIGGALTLASRPGATRVRLAVPRAAP